jgi:transposase
MVRYGMTVRKREDEVFPNAAGIDIGASSHWVAVHRHLADSAGCDPVRQVGAMTVDLQALAAWLVSLGVDTVAVGSTGVYWIPVFEVL